MLWINANEQVPQPGGPRFSGDEACASRDVMVWVDTPKGGAWHRGHYIHKNDLGWQVEGFGLLKGNTTFIVTHWFDVCCPIGMKEKEYDA